MLSLSLMSVLRRLRLLRLEATPRPIVPRLPCLSLASRSLLPGLLRVAACSSNIFLMECCILTSKLDGVFTTLVLTLGASMPSCWLLRSTKELFPGAERTSRCRSWASAELPSACVGTPDSMRASLKAYVVLGFLSWARGLQVRALALGSSRGDADAGSLSLLREGSSDFVQSPARRPGLCPVLFRREDWASDLRT